MGEEPVVFVVAKPGRSIDSDELLTLAAEVLAKFKLPREFTVMDRLPRTAIGKIDNVELRRSGRGQSPRTSAPRQ